MLKVMGQCEICGGPMDTYNPYSNSDSITIHDYTLEGAKIRTYFCCHECTKSINEFINSRRIKKEENNG